MKITKESVKSQLFWWLNILIPVGLNIVMYLLLDSERIGTVLQTMAPTMTNLERALLEQKIVNAIIYVRDALWSYGLIFALTAWMRESLKRVRLAITIAVVFEIGVEVIRVITGVAGTFSLIHVLAVILGNLLAIAFVLHHEHALRKKAKVTTVRLAEVLLILFLFLAGAMLNTQKGLTRVNQLVAQETYYAQFTVQK